MERLGRYFCGLCLIVFGINAIGRAAEPQKKLEETVRRFYDAYIQSKWRTAEQYVDSQSRDVFRGQPKPGILKYQIKNIEMKSSSQEAVVSVGVDMAVPQVGNKIITLNAQTQWRLSRNKWLMVIGAPPPYPTTMMAAIRPTSDKPTPDLRFDYREFDFGQKRQGDLIQIEFPFVNATNHPVQISASLVSICNCIEVGVTKDTVAPGERAAVRFTLKSDEFTFYYHQGIGVKVQPGDGNAILDVTGFLLPADQNPPIAAPNATSEVK